jgi:hypothetical protein
VKPMLAGLASFVVALAAAIWRYPGGTFFDRHSPGFSFWGNFFCDLLHERALNGAPNLESQWLSRLAFASFGVVLMAFWPRAAALAPGPASRRWVSALGITGATLLFGVTLAPSHTEPLLHGVLVLASALPSVAAAIVLGISFYGRTDLITRLLWFALVLTASLSLGQYVRQGLGAEAADWLAGAQKLTAIALLAFMGRCTTLPALGPCSYSGNRLR